MVNIFDFEDYRDYLNAYYEDKKRQNHRFSYQTFASSVGLHNRSSIHNIINGNKNITAVTIEHFSKYLKHSPAQAEYFRYIVLFSQEPENNEEERSFYLEQARIIKSNATMELIQEDKQNYYASWYNSAIRALIEMYPIGNDNYDQLCRILIPPISDTEVKKSIELLQRLKLIALGDNQYYHTTSTIINTDKKIPQHVKDKAHINYLELAAHAIKNIPPSSRHAISHTIGVSNETYEKIVKAIESFRATLRSYIHEDKKVDRIFQLEILLFPLSTNKKED